MRGEVVEVFANLKLSRSHRNRTPSWKTNRDHIQHFKLTQTHDTRWPIPNAVTPRTRRWPVKRVWLSWLCLRNTPVAVARRCWFRPQRQRREQRRRQTTFLVGGWATPLKKTLVVAQYIYIYIYKYYIWLVVSAPLKKWKSIGMMRFPNIWENTKWQPVTTNQVWYLTPTSWYSTLSVGYFEGLGYSQKVPFGRQRWQLNIPICRQISVDGRVFRCDAELLKKQTKNIGMRPKYQ